MLYILRGEYSIFKNREERERGKDSLQKGKG